MAELLRQARQAFAAGEFQKARSSLLSVAAAAGVPGEALHLLALVEDRLGNAAVAEQVFTRAAVRPDSEDQLYIDWCELHARQGHFPQAEQILRQGITRFPQSRPLLLRYANLKRDSDERDDSARIFDHLLKNWLGDPPSLAGRAAVELERGRDARQAYRAARAASPSDRNLLLGSAAALHAAGETREAISLLRREVEREPIWMEGLQTLARLRWEHGEDLGFTADYERAVQRQPRNLGLWAAYIGVLSSGLHYEAALRAISGARKAAGDHPLLDMMEAQALSETGQHEAAEVKFRSLEPIADPSFVPIRLRALLRTGRADEAARLGERFTASGSANFIWPLLGLAWRIIADPRWQWLERYDATVGVADLPLSLAELDEVTHLLRRLHAGNAHPYDQSARGGTQTGGNLFDRTDPPINRLRSAVRDAVRQFIHDLPAVDPSHPFLGRDRGEFRFSGSWSIRLTDEGYHLGHVHPAGWISSALYLSLPEPDTSAGANRHAGWLALGEPPADLGLALPPLRLVEPKRGRLALFPSIMWHGTIPFPVGERLTAAFDIRPFRD